MIHPLGLINVIAGSGVERSDFAFALLDAILGRETSQPVAAALQERGVPFAFAAGYGEAAVLVSRFPHALF